MTEGNVRKGIVLIVRNNQGKYLLLVQNKDNSYSFISGGIDEGETELDTVVREAKEEAGLEIDRNKLVNTGEFIRFVGSSKGPAQQQAYLYELESDDIEINPEDIGEIKDHEWCEAEAVPEKLKEKPPLVELFNKVVKK